MKVGSLVSVPLGTRYLDAVVIGRQLGGRIQVEIRVEGADPVHTSYAPDEVVPRD
jgi:hypothetical protein